MSRRGSNWKNMPTIKLSYNGTVPDPPFRSMLGLDGYYYGILPANAGIEKCLQWPSWGHAYGAGQHYTGKCYTRCTVLESDNTEIYDLRDGTTPSVGTFQNLDTDIEQNYLALVLPISFAHANDIDKVRIYATGVWPDDYDLLVELIGNGGDVIKSGTQVLTATFSPPAYYEITIS